MIPWVHLDTATVPGGGELRLMQRGAEFSIMAGSIELMNSRLSGSEKALATLACERLQGRRRPSLLIGGLGMGFTLRAALADLPRDAAVTVAEIVPAVVAWGRGPMAHIFDGSLEDSRVRVREEDVGEIIRSAHAAFDAILLDVDNGPGGLSREGNDSLYTMAGLNAARRALRPGGVLSIWSAGPDAGFTARLRKAGYAVEELQVRATGARRGARHVIWMAVGP
jgi:spermidine synthase